MAETAHPSANGHAETVRDSYTGVSTTVPGRTSNGKSRAPAIGKVPRSELNGQTTALARETATQLSHTTAGFETGTHRHPVLQLTRKPWGYGVEHDTQLLLWHAMREYIPPLDAAIENRRALEGDLVIESEDEQLQDELREWWEEVPVGKLGNRASMTGGDTYLNMLAENADEYGLGVGEVLLAERGRAIRRLYVPNMRTVSSADRDADGIYELYQNDHDLIERNDIDQADLNRLDNRPTVHVVAFRASTESEWPFPLAWSLKQVAEAFLRILNSTINGWWRFGDPSMHFSLEYDAEADYQTRSIGQTADADDGEDTGNDVEIPEALYWLNTGMSEVMDARREGRVGDMYSYVEGGEINQEVIGQVDQTLMQYVTEHQGHIAAQVIEHSNTPTWMYPSIQQVGDGLGSDRSEKMALAADKSARKRNRRKKAIAREVLDLYLTVTGQSGAIGNYELSFDRLGIMDEQIQADADKTRQEADQLALKNAGLMYGPDGERRFTGEAEDYLEQEGVYPHNEER